MTLADVKIVGVMGRGDFDRPGAEFLVHVSIGNNRNTTIHQGQDDFGAD